jgi:hypothetical protein
MDGRTFHHNRSPHTLQTTILKSEGDNDRWERNQEGNWTGGSELRVCRKGGACLVPEAVASRGTGCTGPR